MEYSEVGEEGKDVFRGGQTWKHSEDSNIIRKRRKGKSGKRSIREVDKERGSKGL